MGLNLFGKKNVSDTVTKAAPYSISTEFFPYRIYANKRGNARLRVKIKNITNEPVLSSVVVELPKQLSFDSTGIEKSKELRVGNIAPNEEKEVYFDINSDTSTDKGEYTVMLTAFVHYRDYGHVLNAERKSISLEAV